MIKGRENKILRGATQSADFLVCFPSRARLTLMPKPICSPVRPSEPTKRHLKRVNTRAAAASGGPNSPLVWDKNNQTRPEIAEPTSPKVTCAGQIKVRRSSSSSGCKNWQSVMEEIERIHNRGKTKKKSKWVNGFGFKKDVMNFLTCLRNLRFDFRCLGGFPESDIISSDDDDDNLEDDEFEITEDEKGNNNNNNNIITTSSNNNGALFSKWFMVLQENNNQGKDITNFRKNTFLQEKELMENDDDDVDESAPAVPPPNALLLMRCRSAPAKSWLQEKELEFIETKEDEKTEEMKVEEEEKKKKKRESLAILMKYDADFYNLSSDIAQETWVGAGCKDPFSRSRSWRR